MNESRLDVDLANQGSTKYSDKASAGEVSDTNCDPDETQSKMEKQVSLKLCL